MSIGLCWTAAHLQNLPYQNCSACSAALQAGKSVLVPSYTWVVRSRYKEKQKQQTKRWNDKPKTGTYHLPPDGTVVRVKTQYFWNLRKTSGPSPLFVPPSSVASAEARHSGNLFAACDPGASFLYSLFIHRAKPSEVNENNKLRILGLWTASGGFP